MTSLYHDEAIDADVVTHSMIKTFRRCARQADYKYNQRLKARVTGTPLKRGVWMHELLEWHHSGRDWRERHRQLCMKWAELLDDEREYYGDIPGDAFALMRAYEWYYQNDPWKVVETEYVLETTFPDGTIYRGRVDAIIENNLGLWIVDHKTHKVLPNSDFRLLDAQSGLYLWAALRNKIKVQGFIWNYLRTGGPSKPTAIQDGSRLSKVLGDTDYHTYVKEVKRLKAAGNLQRITREMKDKADYLKKVLYVPGEPQTSPFFRRDVLEKDSEMLKRVAKEAYHTAQRMAAYDFSDPDRVERTVDRSCTFFCNYSQLCQVELTGGNTQYLKKNQFKVGDPQDYYQDDRKDAGADA